MNIREIKAQIKQIDRDIKQNQKIGAALATARTSLENLLTVGEEPTVPTIRKASKSAPRKGAGRKKVEARQPRGGRKGTARRATKEAKPLSEVKIRSALLLDRRRRAPGTPTVRDLIRQKFEGGKTLTSSEIREMMPDVKPNSIYATLSALTTAGELKQEDGKFTRA